MKGVKKSGIIMTIVGAGSSYTPMIVRELVQRRQRIPVEELRLYDIDPRRLKTVAGFCSRLAGDALHIKTGTRLVGAVKDADFVLSQFRVGGLAARLVTGAPPATHSHSMVPGGFDVTSSTTRLTSRTSFVMRLLIFESTSYGSRVQSAVMASSLETGRRTIGCP